MNDTTQVMECPPESRLAPDAYHQLAGIITKELGIQMPASKLVMLQSRLLRRVRQLQLGSVEEYVSYYLSGAGQDEHESFLNLATTNKTDFFREPEHFTYLAKTALPELLRMQSGPQRLNVWSAACSTGEEPYSLAMVLSDFARLNRGFDFGILATDVSTGVLRKAHAGIYTEAQVAPVPLDCRIRYVMQSKDKSSGLVRVVPALRRKVAFHRLNFMDSSYPIAEMFDVIFLRNVLIYFDRPTQEEVITKTCRHLVPGGYLFVGHSESLAGLDLPLESVRASVFRKFA